VTQGGTVGGNVIVNESLTVNNQEYVNGNVTITGTFLGIVDGGTFS
jgi:cytoskeletal protein CcmA (bactofilin family)